MTDTNRTAALRKGAALSQDELADLLGVTRATIYRIEHSQNRTPINLALKLEALFGVPVTHLFPDLYAAAYEAITDRLASFSITVEAETGEAAERRKAFLADFVRRAPSNSGA